MTGVQASYLKTLCEQAGTPEGYNDNLSKADASKLVLAGRVVAIRGHVRVAQKKRLGQALRHLLKVGCDDGSIFAV